MDKINHINGYWTKEKCQEEALKYKNKSDFRKYDNLAYSAAYRNGWLNDMNYIK